MAVILTVDCSCLNAVWSDLEQLIMIGVAWFFSIKTNDFDSGDTNYCSTLVYRTFDFVDQMFHLFHKNMELAIIKLFRFVARYFPFVSGRGAEHIIGEIAVFRNFKFSGCLVLSRIFIAISYTTLIFGLLLCWP